MKEFAFGNLDFNMANSYKVMKSRVDHKNAVILFNEFSAKIMIYRTFLGVKIELEIDDQDISALMKIDDILIQEYGTPDYIAEGILKVWKEKDFYVVHGMDEKYYKVDVHMIKIYFKKPYPFMLDYHKHEKYVTVLHKISDKWGLKWSKNLIVIDRKMTAWFDTPCYQYYLTFNRNTFAFYSLEKKQVAEGTRLIPSWNKKGWYGTLEKLYYELDSFFNYLEEYDPSLKGK